MKKKSSLPLYLTFSLSIFLLWTLGTWQLNKNFKISKNNKNYQNAAKRNSSKLFSLPERVKNLTYIKLDKVNLTNNFLYLEPRTYNGKVGYHKISVVQVDGKNLLVNEGFIASKQLSKTYTDRNMQIEGFIIKVPEPKFFELKNDAVKKVWYTLKLDDFEKEFDLKLSPYILYQQGYNEDNKLKSVLPNIVSNVNHLNYALTWFFLSFALFIVFFIFYTKNYKKYE